MLSADLICHAIENEAEDAERLSIVPRPDTALLRERGETSVDLRLGRWFRSFKPSQHSQARLWHAEDGKSLPVVRTNEHFVRFGSEFVLHPGRFVLGVTMEWLTLPKSVSGYVTGKSSLGRHGLVIETAAGLHPGFSGCLTLELANVGEVPVAISPGMRICQIFLHRIDQLPKGTAREAEGAEGRSPASEAGNGIKADSFSGQRKPAILLPKFDPVFAALRDGNPG